MFPINIICIIYKEIENNFEQRCFPKNETCHFKVNTAVTFHIRQVCKICLGGVLEPSRDYVFFEQKKFIKKPKRKTELCSINYKKVIFWNKTIKATHFEVVTILFYVFCSFIEILRKQFPMSTQVAPSIR